MLTIKDLSASKELDSAAMTSVRGGSSYLAPFGIVNAPVIDAGVHTLVQGQAVAVTQAGNVGGLNAVANHQTQNGVSGQAVGWF